MKKPKKPLFKFDFDYVNSMPEHLYPTAVFDEVCDLQNKYESYIAHLVSKHKTAIEILK